MDGFLFFQTFSPSTLNKSLGPAVIYEINLSCYQQGFGREIKSVGSDFSSIFFFSILRDERDERSDTQIYLECFDPLLVVCEDYGSEQYATEVVVMQNGDWG